MSPFEELLEKSKAIHLKKRADYTTNPESNPHENFERANEIINWFPSEYKSFASHIGTKLARLGSLLSGNKVPNNESLDDSFLDLVTYCGLMYDFYKRQQMAYKSHEHAQPGENQYILKSPKYKDSPDPTEPGVLRPCYRHLLYNKDCDVCVGQNGPSALDIGLFKEQPATPDVPPPKNLCWHNLVSMYSHRCLNCGTTIQKATDQYYYKQSQNPLYSHILLRQT